MIELGDRVKCRFTGFSGVVVARSEFINGCVQFSVLPAMDKKKNEYPDIVDIDEGSLIPVKGKKKVFKKDTGGPSRPSPPMKGY